MPWHELRRFRNKSIPKLFNLKLARRRGITVPTTYWSLAREVRSGDSVPRELREDAVIVRSASPTEDTAAGSEAGRFLSLVVKDNGAHGDDLFEALERVVDALPRSVDGAPSGAVFLQRFLEPERAGVAFFDGFYYERSTAAGGNQDLTAGCVRGDVSRGHLEPGEPWSEWLRALHRVFKARSGPHGALDIEFAEEGGRFTLLQIRPALFAVKRNPTLSLANHREVGGDIPSPWMVSVLESVGSHPPAYFAEVDPEVASWGESYAVRVAERAWMNFSFFFRLMDHWGLPRREVTVLVGGDDRASGRDGIRWSRFLAKLPTLLRLQWMNLRYVRRAPSVLKRLDDELGRARDLSELHDAAVAAMSGVIRTNMAISGIYSGIARVRRALGLSGRGEVVTQEMMDGYESLRGCPPAEREGALDAWLRRFGHRGPLESDPANPRFAELRGTLLEDLRSSPDAGPGPRSRKRARLPWLYWIDRKREWFRDQLMRRWQVLRRLLLEEGERLVEKGELTSVNDVFWIRGDDLAAGTPLREIVARNRHAVDAVRKIVLPFTTTLDDIQARLESHESRRGAATDGSSRWRGIPITARGVEGTVVRCRELTELLSMSSIGDGAILVVEALEPSWAIVFGRVAGVVVEIGGELSHESILLREANLPAVVNCPGGSKPNAGFPANDGVRLVIDRISCERMTCDRLQSEDVCNSFGKAHSVWFH